MTEMALTYVFFTPPCSVSSLSYTGIELESAMQSLQVPRQPDYNEASKFTEAIDQCCALNKLQMPVCTSGYYEFPKTHKM